VAPPISFRTVSRLSQAYADASAVLFEARLDKDSMEAIAKYGMKGQARLPVGKRSIRSVRSPTKINRRLAKAVEQPGRRVQALP